MPGRGDTAKSEPSSLEKWASILVTPLIVAMVGIIGSLFLANRQEQETRARLYAELLSKREEADSSLRKDMFNSIIASFLGSKTDNLQRKVLNLELLAYNFHDSLDLAPLFKQVHRELSSRSSRDAERAGLLRRLEKVTQDVVAKQVAALEEAGGKIDGSVDFDELEKHPEGITVFGEKARLSNLQLPPLRFQLEVLDVKREERELRLRLVVKAAPRLGEGGEDTIADLVFWVGYFDFPMLDNTWLPEGNRCAVVLREFHETSALITLVYFPASRASVKEKPYYDDVIRELLRPRT
jgi:hypothetical protein